MAGDLRSSILTTAAVAVSVAGLTVIQPLTAAPPLLLAALLMDDGSGEIDGVGGIADAIQQRLLPSDSRGVMVNFLTGPFGIWSALDESGPDGMVPSTALGVTSTMPFINQQGWNLPPQLLPPLAPTGPATVPDIPPPGSPVVSFDLPSLQVGEAVVTPPAPDVPVAGPTQGDVVTSFGYDFNSYAAVSLLNPLALTNSVAAYLTRALSPVQVNADGSVTCRLNMSCDGLDVTTERIDGVLYVTFKNPDGTLVKAKVETRNGVTYVTYEDDGPLPLVRPLRDYFGLFGNELADVLEPALTALVYWGYRDATTDGNNLLPTMADTIKVVLDFIVGVKEGIESLFVGHRSDKDATSSLSAAEEAAESDSDSGSKDKEPSDTTSKPADDEPTDEVTEPTPDVEVPVGEDEEPAPAEEPTDEDAADEEPVGDTEEPVEDEDPTEETEDPAEEPTEDTEEPAEEPTEAPEPDTTDEDADDPTDGETAPVKDLDKDTDTKPVKDKVAEKTPTGKTSKTATASRDAA